MLSFAAQPDGLTVDALRLQLALAFNFWLPRQFSFFSISKAANGIAHH